MPPLSDDEIERILLQGESERSERKRNAVDLDRIREAVCAFANDLPNRGLAGVVFVGIEDNGECANTTVDDELLQRLSQMRVMVICYLFPQWRCVVPWCPVALSLSL